MAAQTVAAFGRALLIALLAVVLSGAARPWLAAQRGRRRLAVCALLLAPFFIPSLLIGGTLSPIAQTLSVSLWSHEAFYIGVLALKLIPAATVLRLYLPPPLSAEAWHLFRQHGQGTIREQWIFRIRGAGQTPWIVGGLVFLLAFAEHDLASLWKIHTWTTTLFDARMKEAELTSLSQNFSLAPAIATGLIVAAVATFLAGFGIRYARKHLSGSRPAHSPEVFIARQMGNRRLLWELELRPRLVAGALFFFWIYLHTPVFGRMHDLALHGHTTSLSAMMLAALLAPILFLLLTATALQLYARRDVR